MSTRMITIVALVMAAASACGDEGPPNPAPFDDGSGAGDSRTPFEPPTKRERKRTIEMRNPLGGPPGNLLVDGDFEFSIEFEGTGPQSGWISTAGYLRGETGGLCRTGLRCGVLEDGAALFGKGTAANGTGMVAGFWAKPPSSADCNAIEVSLLNCNFNGSFIDVPPLNDAPGSGGWCEYKTRVAEHDTALCMYVESKVDSGETTLVDSATIVPADGTAPSGKKMSLMSGARRKKVQQLVDFVRSRRRFGLSPEMPNPRR
jgi:hypothetical protein